MPLVCWSNWHPGTGTEARLQNHYKRGQTKRYMCKYELFIQFSCHFTAVREDVGTQRCHTKLLSIRLKEGGASESRKNKYEKFAVKS